MKIELSANTIVDVVGQSLCDSLTYLRDSVELRSTGAGIPYYDDDPIKDVVFIEEKIEAINLVLELYGLEYKNAKDKS